MFSFVQLAAACKSITAPGLYPDRHQLLRRLPELPVDEIGSDAAHERELFRLPWPDLECARLKGGKRLPHQLLRSDHSDANTFGKLCCHVGLHHWWHELDDFY